jgi:hypothetical protein
MKKGTLTLLWLVIALHIVASATWAEKTIYRLLGFDGVFANGTVVSSSNDSLRYSGIMVLEGNRLTQQVTLNGETTTVSSTIESLEGTTVNLSSQNGFNSKLIVVHGSPVIIFGDTGTYKPYNPLGVSFSEVEKWEFIGTDTEALSVQGGVQTVGDEGVEALGGVGTMILETLRRTN